MHVELAFFEGNVLLCRGKIRCSPSEVTEVLTGGGEHEFEVSHMFEEPACPITIVSRRSGEQLYVAALRMGVHTSDDWESINLGNIHTLAFRCVAPSGGAA